VLLPGDVQVSITRDYGATAAEKSNELLYHMLNAVVSVSLLIAFALGRREALVVLIAIPVMLALTLFAFVLYGYTLNRITLFALIFSIGILVETRSWWWRHRPARAHAAARRALDHGGDCRARGGRSRQPDPSSRR
jgi:hypothetical protein